jgi:HD-GYP domain-containing protein (c-di-GMP phosphodiesterase class II)
MDKNKERAISLYEEALTLAEEVLSEESLRQPVDGRKVQELIEKIAGQLMTKDKELLILTSRFSEENYLRCHMVNVAILSMKVGLELGYNKSRLVKLGIGAFLHDVGMIKVLPLVSKRRKLTKKEYSEVKKHPIYGAEILDRSYRIEPSTIYVAHQQHERMDGSGYPRGLENDDISENARIVGLVDMYEAMTHPRPYRKRTSLAERAIKEIMESNGNLFEQHIIKALVKCLNLYPVGSWVQLNTGEIGRVAGTHENFPLRPRVTVMFDQNYKLLKKMKKVELKDSQELYIESSIDENELKKKSNERG